LKLLKMRNGQFVKLSEADADKLIEEGKAAEYDLKKGSHAPFKPLVLKPVALTKEQEKAKRVGKAKTKRK